MSDCGRLLYCHCAYAKVVPEEAKRRALAALVASGREFEAVPDLCELSAREDPSLAELAERAGGKRLDVVACYPRAVRWLFHAAGHALPDGARIANMRGEDLDGELRAFLVEDEA